MMIKPISEYCGKRNKSRPKTPREHLVYVVRPVGERWHKVGLTTNMGRRLVNYESNSGRDFEVRMQFVVSTSDDAKALEKEIINSLAGRYEGRGKEWFLMQEYDLLAEAKRIVETTRIAIKEVRGRASHDLPEYDLHRAVVRECRASMPQRVGMARITKGW